MIRFIENVTRTISIPVVFPAAYPNWSKIKRERRNFELTVYLKLMSSKANCVKGCCESTFVVDALGSSSGLRKRICGGESQTEVLERIQTTRGQLSKVRVVDVEPCSEALKSRLESDLDFVYKFLELHNVPLTAAMTEYSKQQKLDTVISVENLVASTIADFKETCLKEDPKNKTQTNQAWSGHLEAKKFVCHGLGEGKGNEEKEMEVSGFNSASSIQPPSCHKISTEFGSYLLLLPCHFRCTTAGCKNKACSLASGQCRKHDSAWG